MKTTFIGALALAALFGACGDKKLNSPDAAPDQPDADTTGHDIATITVSTPAGAALVGAHVLFLKQEDDSLIMDVTTDASGVAMAAVPPSAKAVVIDAAAPGGPQIYALTSIGPNKSFKVFAQVERAASMSTYTFTALRQNNATMYRLTTPCGKATATDPGGIGASVDIALMSDTCGATGDIVIEALGNGNANLGTFFKAGATFTANATVNLTAGFVYNTAANLTYNVMHTPDGVNLLAKAQGSINIDTLINVANFNAGNSDIVSNAFMATFKTPNLGTSAASYVYQIQLQDAGSALGTQLTYLKNDAITTTATTIDLMGKMMPGIGNRADATFDLANAWLDYGEFASGRGVPTSRIAGYTIRRTGMLVATWNLAGAYDVAGQITYPRLPGDYAMYNPMAGDTFAVNLIGLIKADMRQDAILANPFELFVGRPVDVFPRMAGDEVSAAISSAN